MFAKTRSGMVWTLFSSWVLYLASFLIAIQRVVLLFLISLDQICRCSKYHGSCKVNTGSLPEEPTHTKTDQLLKKYISRIIRMSFFFFSLFCPCSMLRFFCSNTKLFVVCHLSNLILFAAYRSVRERF